MVVRQGDAIPQRAFGNLWRQSWLSQLRGERDSTGIKWMETRDAVIQKTASHHKESHGPKR